MNIFRKIGSSTASFIKIHKVISAIIAIVIIAVGYYGYKDVFAKTTTTTYVLGQVTRGTITTTVTGTGQVSPSDEVDINPKASGEVTQVDVKVGDSVKAGQVIAQIDDTTAEKTLRDAQASLTGAEITYQKALQQSQSSLTTDQASVTSSQNALSDAYLNAYNAMASAYIDMPPITDGLNDIYYTSSHSPYFSDPQAEIYAGEQAVTYKYQAGVIFDKAKTDFTTNFAAYKAISLNSSSTALVTTLQQTYTNALEFQNALQGTYNAIDYINLRILTNKPTQIASDENELDTYLSKINSDVSALSSAITSIDNAQQSLTDATTSLANDTATLNGSDSLDVQSAKLTLTQAQNAVTDAQVQDSYYTVTAPFDGVIAKVDVQVGDTTSGAVATEISPQQVAQLTLNEVDAEKVKIGQKATLTFDAVPDLTLTGTVIEVDTLGTVSQGVVSYGVQIQLDTQNSEVKSGMSVSAAIITDYKVDTLIVPSSAVKTQGSVSYVQVSSSTTAAPQSVQVQTGISDDTNTEILSGLTEGQSIVVRTVSSANTTSAPAARSATSILGGGGGGAARGGFTGRIGG